MTASRDELSELKEWLADEVKLERYYDKLTKNGFCSLSSLLGLTENDLDTIGINPLYHRRRILKYCGELHANVHANRDLCTGTGNDHTPGCRGTEILAPQHEEKASQRRFEPEGCEDEGFEPPPLPPKINKFVYIGDVAKAKPFVPDRVSSLPRQQDLDEENTEVSSETAASVAKNEHLQRLPDIPTKATSNLDNNVCFGTIDSHNLCRTDKRPPPIPPRADLDVDQGLNQTNGGSMMKTSQEEGKIGNGQESSHPLSSMSVASPSPKPVARPRTNGREKPAVPKRRISPPLSNSDQETGGTELHNDDALKPLSSKVEEVEDSGDTLYGNVSDCTPEAARLPATQPEKTHAKKPLPAPRIIKPVSIKRGSEKSKLLIPDKPDRHSIAGSENNNKQHEEERNARTELITNQTKSLNRPTDRRIEPREESAPEIYPIENDQPPAIPPHGVSQEDQMYECVPDDTSKRNVPKASTGTYEEVQKHPATTTSEEAIHESMEDEKPDIVKEPTVTSKQSVSDYDVVAPTHIPVQRKQRKGVHPLKVMSIIADKKIRNSMFGQMKGVGQEGMFDYESDEGESSEENLMDEPPKPRNESTECDGQPPTTPKSRKTSGYLFKQGGQQNNKGWRKRWFVFDGNDLRYYRNEDNTKETLHIVPVSQMKTIEYDKNDTKRARFNLVTSSRVFMLASDTMTETNLWAQTLMEAIILHKVGKSIKKVGGTMSEPDKEGWLKKQGHNVMGDWKKRYVAIKEEKICYYDTYEDYTCETPIHFLDAKLASVKQDMSHRNRFQIVTPYKAFSFQADNEIEASSWISAIQTAIQMGLGDHSIIDQVWLNPANKKCADCGKKDPVWAAVNYCICVCAQCIGVHRSLGVKFSKPRSLLMDQKIWNKQLIELMIRIGNANSNKLLEHKIPEDDRILPDSENERRIEFIYSKYKYMKYSKISKDYGDPETLGQSLQSAVVTDDILKTMELIINRVNVKYVSDDSEDQRLPLELAQDAGQELQTELLRQNGADLANEPPSTPVLSEEEHSEMQSPLHVEITSPTPVEIPERAGFLYKKEGSSMKKRLWFTLKDRSLKYYRTSGDREPSGTIDLKTVTTLEMRAGDDARTLDIGTADKSYTLKGESDEELESWYAAIKNKQVFNVHLSFQDLGSDGIPHLVANCLQFVETYGLQAEGIYRVNGNQAKIRALKQAFNQDASLVMLTLDDYSVHDVTGTLKKYLRELPEPVFPDGMYKEFIAVSRNSDHDTKLMGMKSSLENLPKVNYDTLKRIIGHLTKVIADQTVNRMGIENISMIFGPTLMSNEKTGKMDDSSINQEFMIVGVLVKYYQWFFDVDDKELEKNKLMEKAMKKITQIQEGCTGAMNQEFTLDVYIQKKNDSPCLIKVAAGMTAGELCMNTVSGKGLPQETNWVLFEVIGKLNLERALSFREKVLPAVMAWEDFGEIRKDNYLIIKENHIAESIQPFASTTLTLEGQLHVREPKRKDWKLSTVMVKNGYMVMDKSKSFFKSIKSDKSDANQWSLHNLLVYVGVPIEKQTKGVDTSAGFTVVVKTDQQGSITRYLCGKDKTELFRWVAAILNMKHPEGIWNDPTAMAELSVSSRRVQDKQVYLGRQSHFLRREGSSNHIAEEIRVRQKSLRRSITKDPPS